MQARIMPAFEVEPLEGEIETTVVKFTRKKQGEKYVLRREEDTVKKPAGWMVYTAKGDSIRVRTKEDMKHLGFMDERGRIRKPLVDMNSGEPVPGGDGVSLKDLSARRTARNDIRSAVSGA